MIKISSKITTIFGTRCSRVWAARAPVSAPNLSCCTSILISCRFQNPHFKSHQMKMQEVIEKYVQNMIRNEVLKLKWVWQILLNIIPMHIKLSA